MVSSLIFFASLRASLMSAEICFSLGGSVFLRSFTATTETFPLIFPLTIIVSREDYARPISGSCGPTALSNYCIRCDYCLQSFSLIRRAEAPFLYRVFAADRLGGGGGLGSWSFPVPRNRPMREPVNFGERQPRPGRRPSCLL